MRLLRSTTGEDWVGFLCGFFLLLVTLSVNSFDKSGHFFFGFPAQVMGKVDVVQFTVDDSLAMGLEVVPKVFPTFFAIIHREVDEKRCALVVVNDLTLLDW